MTTDNDEAATGCLSQEDLSDFLLRRSAVEQAVLASNMIQAGYRLWADGIRRRYSVTGNFDVCPETGEIFVRDDDSGDSGA